MTTPTLSGSVAGSLSGASATATTLSAAPRADALDLGVSRLADDDDGIALLAQLVGVLLDFRDVGASRVDDLEAARDRLGLDGGRRAVAAQHERAVLRLVERMRHAHALLG